MQNNVLYVEAIKRVMNNDTANDNLPEGDLGIDPETGKGWSTGRAKRQLRKHMHELTRQNLTQVKLKDLLEAQQETAAV